MKKHRHFLWACTDDLILSFSPQQECDCKTIGSHIKHIVTRIPDIVWMLQFLLLHSFSYKHSHVSTGNYQLMLWPTCKVSEVSTEYILSGFHNFTYKLIEKRLLKHIGIWMPCATKINDVPFSKSSHSRFGFNPVIMCLVKTF